MRLSAVPLITYDFINSFTYGIQWMVRANDPLNLYFQIVDLDRGPYSVIGGWYNYSYGFNGPANVMTGTTGLRYMLGIGSSNQPYAIRVTFPSIDSSKVLPVFATQADASDASIWKVSVSSTQSIGSGNVEFTVYEGAKVYNFSVLDMLNVQSLNNGCC